MSELKSKHAFGSEANIDAALAQGLIDEYDILFLSEGKIGWIDKDGNKVIIEDKKHVTTVGYLPEVGDFDTIYICNNKFYFWDGIQFTSPSSGSIIDEAVVDSKVDAARTEAIEIANAYTDERLAEAFIVVEF